MTYAIMLPSRHGQILVNRLDDHQPGAILRTGTFHIEAEVECLSQIVGLLPPAATVLDCGANVGLIAIPLARKLAASGGALHAFEPQRFCYYMLAGNAALSGLLNLHCHRFALGAQAGHIEVPVIDPYAANDFGAISLAGPAQGSLGHDRIAQLTIDDCAFEQVGLIKLDVEGMEPAVLEGARRTIAAQRPFIWIEIWPPLYAEVTAWLKDAGYRLFVFDALNFLAVPDERCDDLPLILPPFDGKENPHFARMQASWGEGSSG